MIPIRCFSCGKVVANKWMKYQHSTKSIEKGGEGRDPNDVLNEMGYDRYCCRRMFITCVDLTDELLMYDAPREGDARHNPRGGEYKKNTIPV